MGPCCIHNSCSCLVILCIRYSDVYIFVNVTQFSQKPHLFSTAYSLHRLFRSTKEAICIVSLVSGYAERDGIFGSVTVKSLPEKVLYIIFYHPLLFIFLWSYWQTIFTPTGKVPKEFYLSKQELEIFERETNEERQREMLLQYAKHLPLQNRTMSGAPRYCEKCKCLKPDRCHHCSVCSSCVLKMDHHCPWVNNCVGFTNYKYFVLFLGYSLLYCLYVAATSLQYFIEFWTANETGHAAGRLHILFLFFASVMFGLSLISLFGYHIFLILHNRTTLEAFRAPIFQTGQDKDGFSLGKCNNFVQIFGEDKLRGALPLFTSIGDGVSYPTRTAPANTYQTMGTTPSVGDGITYPTRTVDLDSDHLLGERQRWMEEGEANGTAGENLKSSDSPTE